MEIGIVACDEEIIFEYFGNLMDTPAELNVVDSVILILLAKIMFTKVGYQILALGKDGNQNILAKP
jgi:hypothetical protein